ncbi:MAG TPA: pilus assembly protein N-terminal domain-containing protein, partial [Sphingomonadales bacterium]
MRAGLKKHLAVLGLALAAAFAAPITSAAAQSAGVQRPNGAIEIEVSNGTLIQLKAPASSVFIADPEVADVQVKSPRMVYVFGKKAGSTSLYALSDKDEVLYSGTVRVNHNLSLVRDALNRMIPGGNLDIQEMGGVMVLTGKVKSPAEAADAAAVAKRFLGEKANVLNRISVATPTQVNIRVRVAEVARDVSKQLGFNWEGAFGGKSFIGIQNAADVFEWIPDPAGGPGV